MAEALTLVEAAKLSQNDLQSGVIQNIANFDPVLHGGGGYTTEGRPLGLLFVATDNEVYEYNRENTNGSAVWFDPDEEITGETSTFTNVTVTMRSIARSFDVPKFVAKAHSDVTDQEAIQMRSALKGFADEFMTAFWYGQNSANSKVADGVAESLPTANKFGESDGALNLSSLDEVMIDYMKFGTDMLVTNRAIVRLMQSAARATAISGTINYSPAEMGKRILYYADTPLFASDFITSTESWSTETFTNSTGGTTASSVYALKFGVDMAHGLQLGGGPYVEYFDKLERKNSTRWRIIWHVVPYVRKSLCAAGAVVNVSTDTAVAA